MVSELFKVEPTRIADRLLRVRKKVPVRMAAQKYRTPGKFDCNNCGKTYKYHRALHRHKKYECGIVPRFQCPHCVYRGRHRFQVYEHIRGKHPSGDVYVIET